MAAVWVQRVYFQHTHHWPFSSRTVIYFYQAPIMNLYPIIASHQAAVRTDEWNNAGDSQETIQQRWHSSSSRDRAHHPIAEEEDNSVNSEIGNKWPDSSVHSRARTDNAPSHVRENWKRFHNYKCCCAIALKLSLNPFRSGSLPPYVHVGHTYWEGSGLGNGANYSKLRVNGRGLAVIVAGHCYTRGRDQLSIEHNSFN